MMLHNKYALLDMERMDVARSALSLYLDDESIHLIAGYVNNSEELERLTRVFEKYASGVVYISPILPGEPDENPHWLRIRTREGRKRRTYTIQFGSTVWHRENLQGYMDVGLLDLLPSRELKVIGESHWSDCSWRFHGEQLTLGSSILLAKILREMDALG